MGVYSFVIEFWASTLIHKLVCGRLESLYHESRWVPCRVALGQVGIGVIHHAPLWSGILSQAGGLVQNSG